MATSEEYVLFVCEQIRSEFPVRYKKMFGEYMVYVNEKPVLLVCDNTVYVKKLEEIKGLMQNAEVGVPYKGAKEHFILDIEDNVLANRVIDELEKMTPVPVRKKKN